jgi:radical SAM protein with 4Fe4S-binding SPASM domain
MTETIKDCSYPWTWMMVAADGDVKPCCYSARSMGNLHEATVDEVWNGPLAIELRRFIKEGKIHPICEDAACKYVQNTVAAKRAAIKTP